MYLKCVFFSPLNGIFDTELVHLYLSDSVQMSIKYHWYVKTTGTTK